MNTIAISAILALTTVGTSLNSVAQLEADLDYYTDLNQDQQAYADFVFDASDVDDDYSLSRAELDDALSNAGVDLNMYPSWLRKFIFRRADQDRSGEIEFDEYLDTLYRFAPERLGY